MEEAENNLPTKHLRSFWSFWLHGFKKAFKKSWEKYNHALAAFVILYLIAAASLQKCERLSKWVQKYHKDFDMSLWVQLIIPVALLLIFLGWHFAKAPYEIYVEQNKKHAKDLAEKDASLNSLGDRFDALGVKYEEILKAKDKQISLLESELEKDKKIKSAKNILGLDLLKLDNRLAEANKMPLYHFSGTIKEEAWRVTSELFMQVEANLNLKLTFAEYSRFTITDGKPTQDYKPNSEVIRKVLIDREWHINCILAKRDKLAEILSELR